MHDTGSDRAGLALTRRRLLGGLVVGGAAALGHAARGSAATEWEQAVAAAKKEGKVAVNTFTGQGFARVFKLFSQAHPDIKLDHTNLEPVDFVPRVTTERRAGLYTWDVCTMPMSTAPGPEAGGRVGSRAASDHHPRGPERRELARGLRGRLPRPRPTARLRLHAGARRRRLRQRRPGEGRRAHERQGSARV